MSLWFMRYRGSRLKPFAGRSWLMLAGAIVLSALGIGAAVRLVSQARARAAIVSADPDTILTRPDLRETALSIGAAVYHDRCASCHGSDGAGSAIDGVPNLRDHDWLYGDGRVSEIEGVVRYGIRAHTSKGWNLASMPAYASARPYAAEPIPPLTPGEVADIVQLLLRYEGQSADPAAVARGIAIYQKAGCWDCHGPSGVGDPAVGAPNLRDRFNLYGGSSAALTRTVEQGRHGVSPAFADSLNPAQIRAVAAFVASLSSDGSTRRKVVEP